MTYRVERLADHDLSEFTCGNMDLDDWLRSHAQRATGQGTRTYILVDEHERVCGYFALAPHLLSRDDAPPRLARGAPQQIPGILLAKLALDSAIQGRGMGAELLVRALDTIIAAARRAGGRVVIVDAIDDDAVAFYEHHDFRRLPGQSWRLVMKLSSAAKALGLPWP
ncbi:MAG TPA: GNAT family N-acetyltransferase [Acidimicrobiales bacterium]|nr:GNAT family N-acetyltransferase [Acidimicrobiales bacterium]